VGKQKLLTWKPTTSLLFCADDSPDVERECQALIALIEQYLGEGETLQQFF
jgi:hypothetical protein